MQAIRQSVKASLSSPAVLQKSLEDRIGVINPVLRGWAQYFRTGNSSRKFVAVDQYVYHRLAIFLRAKHQRRYLRWSGRGSTSG